MADAEPVGLARWAPPPFLVASQLEDSAEYNESFHREGSVVSFNNEVLRGLELTDTVLVDGWFDETDLSGSRLDRAWFHGAYVTDANLSGARLVRCRLRKSQWGGTDLTGAVGDGGYFFKSDMRESRWDGGSFVGASFLQSDLADCTLVGADLRRADFREADLERVDLTGADVTGADFDRAYFYPTTRLPAGFVDMTRPGQAWVEPEKLSGPALHARLAQLEQPPRTDLPPLAPSYLPAPREVLEAVAASALHVRTDGKQGALAVLAGARLGGVELVSASLSGAELSGAELSFSRLDYTRLKHATLTGADLTGARLVRIEAWDSDWVGCALSGAIGDGADFAGADLRDTRWDRGSFIGAGFAKVNLSGASLVDAALRNSDFRDANLAGADLSGADVTGAEFTGASFDSHTRLPAGFADLVLVAQASVDGVLLPAPELATRLRPLHQSSVGG